MKSRALSVVAGLLLVAFAGTANATDYVILNGQGYACQNRCVITTSPGGGWELRDSEGGWVTQYNVDQDPPLDP